MDATLHAEIERKYDIDESTVLPSLAGVAGVDAVTQAATSDLDALYYDTEDLALARRGITLRRRTGGPDEGWHAKLPAGPDTKTEVRLPLDAAPAQDRSVKLATAAEDDRGEDDRAEDDSAGGHGGSDGSVVPPALLDPIRAVVRDHRLIPVARVRNHRLSYDLLDPDGTLLGQVTDDTVTGERLLAPSAACRWREWEVELADESPLGFEAVESALLTAGARQATAGSKLARALGLDLRSDLGRGSPPKTQADATVGEVLTAHLAGLVARVQEDDAGLRTQRDDAVHRLRIAARRLRSALATFAPVLQPDATDAVRGDLRWLGQSLAGARDAQVLRERLLALVAEERSELVLGPVTARVDLELGREITQRSAEAREALDSTRYFRLLDALDELVARPPLTAEADESASTVLPQLLHRDLKRLRREVKTARKEGDPDRREAALHEARKKAKRLRYAAESAEPVLGKPAKRLAKRTKRVQEALGVRRDTVLSRAVLRDLAVRSHVESENGFTFGRLHALEEWHAQEAEDAFRAAWRKLGREKLAS